MLHKMGIASVCGILGGAVGTPADVANIRMCDDGRLPVEQQRKYRGVVNALVRITREEGVFSLFKGICRDPFFFFFCCCLCVRA